MSEMRVYGHELMRTGGKWLGAARSWLQRKKLNGEYVIWGSNEQLQPPMTVREVEEIAAESAAAVYNELAEAKELITRYRKEKFDLQVEVACLQAQLARKT